MRGETLDVLVDEATQATRTPAPYNTLANRVGRELFTNFRRHAAVLNKACTWL